ncbi:GNAT family N-acetyltransferase [Ferrimonas marina]|uniref:Putative acetyltransferase n=1 Tax=Ferrimonas marina TaxID=299255 RepID=A0A1M5QXZ0_9GAMM|nr:GNAT family N-acetyltransferase [Ferrimonas marina]SHH19067.1 putative acetyltransferase [Ferrimonas marina]
MSFELRPIEPRDNARIAEIIRAALTEFGANQPGFAWADPELDSLCQVYSGEGSRYLVVEKRGEILGGAGLAPYQCHLKGVCELQKMYLSPGARGLGAGRSLVARLIQYARRAGYNYCYLETYGPMTQAQQLYESLGFRELDAPWGSSGHTGCDRWYAMRL